MRLCLMASGLVAAALLNASQGHSSFLIQVQKLGITARLARVAPVQKGSGHGANSQSSSHNPFVNPKVENSGVALSPIAKSKVAQATAISKIARSPAAVSIHPGGPILTVKGVEHTSSHSSSSTSSTVSKGR